MSEPHDIKPMQFHKPGWSLDTGKVNYAVWGPQTKVFRDDDKFPGHWTTDWIQWHDDGNAPRADWTANVNPYGLSIFAHHAHEHGDTFEQAIAKAGFPDDIRKKFEHAVKVTA
jgi:hypothetical protein